MWNIIIGSCGWTLTYLFLLKTINIQSKEAISRVLAFLHSFIASRCVEMFVLSYPFQFQEFGQTTGNAETRIIEFSVAYFLFETVYCLYSQTEDWIMMLHHFVSLSALTWCLWICSGGYECCLIIWSAEFTNPVLQARWFLRSWGWQGTLLGRVNEVLFVVLFFAMRGGFGMVYTYHLYKENRTEVVLKHFGYVFQLVNFLFLYQVGRLVLRRVRCSGQDVKKQK